MLMGHIQPQILMGISELLNNPNNSDPAQTYGYEVFRKDKAKYAR
jgi:ubiquitin-protein ligase